MPSDGESVQSAQAVDVAEGAESSLGKALADFQKECLFVRVLGSYPEAENQREEPALNRG